jgi:peptidoglycan/xylan/chitin deacetylase (PgdA/CDA1 family)
MDVSGPAIVRHLPAATAGVFLTFDDGPDTHWTPRILEILARYGAGASFFVIGQLVRHCGPLLREIRAAGHAVGNHGWSHRHPWTLTRALAREEVRAGSDEIAQALGERPTWFRPPHGRLNAGLLDAVHAEHQHIALWSVSAIDWGPFGAPHRVLPRLDTVGPGDIVLMHDGPWLYNRPASTVRELPSFLARLEREGARPLSLPDATLGE